MLIAQDITYIHSDKEILFDHISCSLREHDKVALIGNNGSGKSTLLKIIAGHLQPAQGSVKYESMPYYIPQQFGQFRNITVAGALQVEHKVWALKAILGGDASESNLLALHDDWNVEERSREALSYWGLHELQLECNMEELSGGEKMKVFLAGILIHKPSLLLLDEPTNHLDTESREVLYDFISSQRSTLLVVSHDRMLLELLNPVWELNRHGINVYGGNYSFYREQQEIAVNALVQQLEEKEKMLNKARKVEQKIAERKQRMDSRGQKKHEKEGISRIYMKKLRNKAETSAAKLKEVHSAKVGFAADELRQIRQKLPDIRKIKMDLEGSALREGKVLVHAENINYGYDDSLLWNNPMSFCIRSGERIHIKGANGSGKTTLIRMILGEIFPVQGVLKCPDIRPVYIDQDYSLLSDEATVYEQAQLYNDDVLPEHEVRIRLNRYLFGRDSWDKPCRVLSGGERMRLMLCCMMVSHHAPDMLILDEPTNNLDIQNIEILTKAIHDYSGTLLVVSHDRHFVNEIQIDREIEL